MKNRVGLFGGSFDPVHFGHQKIVRSFLRSDLIDVLWILPTASPPHKSDQTITSYDLRCQMVDAAFKDWSRVRVSRVEEQLPAPNYTLQTVTYLQNEYPDYVFILCIGSDSLQQISSWYKYRELLSKCDLLVASRPDYKVSTQVPYATVDYVEHEPVPYSSTEVRHKVERKEPVNNMVPEEVISIIESNRLYVKD